MPLSSLFNYLIEPVLFLPFSLYLLLSFRSLSSRLARFRPCGSCARGPSAGAEVLNAKEDGPGDVPAVEAAAEHVIGFVTAEVVDHVPNLPVPV